MLSFVAASHGYHGNNEWWLMCKDNHITLPCHLLQVMIITTECISLSIAFVAFMAFPSNNEVLKYQCVMNAGSGWKPMSQINLTLNTGLKVGFRLSLVGDESPDSVWQLEISCKTVMCVKGSIHTKTSGTRDVATWHFSLRLEFLLAMWWWHDQFSSQCFHWSQWHSIIICIH